MLGEAPAGVLFFVLCLSPLFFRRLYGMVYKASWGPSLGRCGSWAVSSPLLSFLVLSFFPWRWILFTPLCSSTTYAIYDLTCVLNRMDWQTRHLCTAESPSLGVEGQSTLLQGPATRAVFSIERLVTTHVGCAFSQARRLRAASQSRLTADTPQMQGPLSIAYCKLDVVLLCLTCIFLFARRRVVLSASQSYLLADEEFCMQTDSHMDVLQGWDESIMNEWVATENE